MKLFKLKLPEWTVARLGGEIADYFYGYNLRTGLRLPLRDTYGEALKDVEKKELDEAAEKIKRG
jgi:hypothetical protein